MSWVNGDLPVERDQLIDDIAALWLSLSESASDMARSRLDDPPGEYLSRISPLWISKAMAQRTRQLGQRIRDRE